MSAEALPAIVEAGLRSGHATEAAAALADLERCAAASGTAWALGLLARSTALMSPLDQAGLPYQIRNTLVIRGNASETWDAYAQATAAMRSSLAGRCTLALWLVVARTWSFG